MQDRHVLAFYYSDMPATTRFLIAASQLTVAALGAQPAAISGAVGFRIIRPSTPTTAIAMWYPAERTSRAEAMKLEDYLTAEVPADRLATVRADFLDGIARSYAGARGLPTGPKVPYLPDSVASALMSLRTNVVRDATPLPGRRPVLFFIMPMGSTGAANGHFIAQEIASLGYVVVSGPPVNVPRGTSTGEYMRQVKSTAETLYDAVVRLPNVDPTQLVALDPTASTALLMEAERKRWHGVIVFDEVPFEPETRDALTRAAGSISTSLPTSRWTIRDQTPMSSGN
ncbi:MAG TPA: hypothetical protein VFZ21_27800 [Gemmatimonadaceae bacterium]|nr:hypothetical protein [Gemmatimonadaceae bacterium]